MTDIHVDSSCLPPVQEVCRDFAVLEDGALAYCLQEQEIELHYASNIQKNQLVQKDLRIAKRLQDQEMEAQKLQASNHQKEIKEKDSENTQDLQAGLERRTKEDCQKSKVQAITGAWKEKRAKRFLKMEKEEHEKQGSRASRGTDGALDPLCGGMAKLELQNHQQVQEDEQLARKLQAEEEQEESLLRARRNREQDDSYRAAQVAQDEEIARYLQDKELAAQWGSPSKDPSSKLKEQPSKLWEGRGSTSQQMEAWQSDRTPPQHRTETEGGSEVTVRRNSTDKKPQLCWNIAEALDPTFQASKMGRPPDGMDLGSQASAPGQLGQVDGPFAPAFVSPTKRQPEKAGCSKSSEKKESCRQQ